MQSPAPSSPSIRAENSPVRQFLRDRDLSRSSSLRRGQSFNNNAARRPSETRELSNEISILHKENEHKEHRISALTKEIQSLRVTHHNDQVRLI